MRKRLRNALWLVMSFVVLGEYAHAANVLYLPRLFDPSEMATTGVALVNPTTTAASCIFRWRNAQGTVIATSQQSIPAKGQVSLTLSRLFPNVPGAGWMSVDIGVDQVTGFWLTGDFVTSTDGAALLSSNDSGPYPNYILFASTSVISFANIDSSALSGDLTLANADGQIVSRVRFQTPALGIFQDTVASLFPSFAADFDSSPYSIQIVSDSSTAKVLGTAVTPYPGRDNVVTNAANFISKSFVFPQIADGKLGATTYQTLLTLAETKGTAANVTLTLRPSSGAPLSIQKSIPPWSMLRSTITSLFGVASVDGWLQVSSDDYLDGMVSYKDTGTGGTTAVEKQFTSAADTGLIFGHIADLSPWWTGIALTNSSNTAAQVELYAMDSSGKLIGGPVEFAAAQFTIPALSKKVFLLSEMTPQIQARASDGGYVYIRTTNGVALNGIELFFLRSGLVYANVPATRVGGLALTPLNGPTSTSGGSVTIQSAFIGDANRNPITSFRPGDTITLNIRINNTWGQAITCTREYRAVGPQGYLLYSNSFTGDQAAGISTRSSSVVVPATAPSGTYTFTGTATCNGVTSSASTTFTFGSSGGTVGSGGTSGTGGTGGGTIGGSSGGPTGGSGRVTAGPVTLNCQLRTVGATCTGTLNLTITATVRSSQPSVIMALSGQSDGMGGAAKGTTSGSYVVTWNNYAIASSSCRNTTFQAAISVYDGTLDQNPPLIGNTQTTVTQTCK